MKLVQLTGSDAYAINNPNLVVGSSLIYDEKFSVCYNLNDFDQNIEYLQEEVARRMRRIPSGTPEFSEFEFVAQPKAIADISGTTIPFNLIHPYNYFHFLIESLPSLLNLVNSKLIERNDVIVSGILHANMLHALKLVTDHKFQVLELNLWYAVKSTKTIVAKDSFSGNELISGKLADNYHYNHANLNSLRRFFEKYFKSNANLRGCKLFIVRQSGQRNIVNLRELTAVAETRGFLIVNPETLSLLQQIELFCSASTIVGPSGAWLANLLFVRKEAKVKVLYPETCRTAVSIWKKLGNIFDISVSDHYFNDYILNTYQPIHSDFTVDLNLFNDIVDN